MSHRFNYEWLLADANFKKDKGTVFSCFACGGGSTMGYKLAGFDVLGCNEIDPKMIDAYRANHNPKYSYLEPIQSFKLRKDLPAELYNLDILDGSPPCSSFSMSGNREKDWGKKKKFREGQAEQVLDDLFFDFIDLANELQPKVIVAENVSGLLMGAAKKYVIKIYNAFKQAGYELRIQPYLLDASKMGVPQKRKRVFFIAIRNDLAAQFMHQVDMFQTAPKLELFFNEPSIKYKEIEDIDDNQASLTKDQRKWYVLTNIGDFFSVNHPKGSWFNHYKADPEEVLYTITSTVDGAYNYQFERLLNDKENCLAGSYPLDYNFTKNKVKYLVGMSVPPVMMANVATEIYNQWLSQL